MVQVPSFQPGLPAAVPRRPVHNRHQHRTQDSEVARDLIPAGASVKKNSSRPANVNKSAEPRNRYCNATQKNDIGSGSIESTRPEFSATCFLFTSTSAAVTIATMERTKPIPILWRWVIPFSVRVSFRAMGMITWSYKGARAIMKITGKIGREAGGTVSPPTRVSIVAAC
ncbi:hypothetical protein IEQ34_003075 [Dendrobium chrysotoxum]|uniref:Uncharacterized protein n=1 Tax=Dendrobium chrysotoxum TaxID=161865 RepID=A0AAV7HGJ9_DENCH|nr:hypothetical protein IEQ34_003075 [Dendrobium chrysotoxum]